MFQVPSTISKITTMADKSIRLQVDTQELSSSDKSLVFDMHERFGYFVFKETEIKKTDIEELPDIPLPPKEKEQKTKSQTFRAVLYLIWKQKGKKDMFGRGCDSETYYNQIMEHLIENYKSKLD